MRQIFNYLSNVIDYDDWQTTNEFFEFIDSFWGPHTVDRFASADNAKLQRFNSLFWHPSSEAPDTFSKSWNSANNWSVQFIFLLLAMKLVLLMSLGDG